MSSVTAMFDSLVRRESYSSYSEFLQLFKKFQKASGTCYAVVSSCSRAQWMRRYRKFLPANISYKSVRFRCVHASRECKSKKKTFRLPDFSCGSFLTVRERGGVLVIRDMNLEHSHEVRSSLTQSYPRNRRLSEDQMLHISLLLKHFTRPQVIQQYVKEMYEVSLTNNDIRRIRDKYRDIDTSNEPDQQLAVVPSLGTEPSASPVENKLTDSSPENKMKMSRKVCQDLQDVLLNLDSTQFNLAKKAITELMVRFKSYTSPNVLQTESQSTDTDDVIRMSTQSIDQLEQNSPVVAAYQSFEAVVINDDQISSKPLLNNNIIGTSSADTLEASMDQELSLDHILVRGKEKTSTLPLETSCRQSRTASNTCGLCMLADPVESLRDVHRIRCNNPFCAVWYHKECVELQPSFDRYHFICPLCFEESSRLQLSL